METWSLPKTPLGSIKQVCALPRKETALPRQTGLPIGPKVKSLLDSTASMIRFVLRQRLGNRRIASFEDLTEFLATRSSYIAQTSLYGYLKTRMGTKFRIYFEDEEYSRIIQGAAIKLYASCLSDLSVYSVALLIEQTTLSPEGAQELARNLYDAALPEGVKERDLMMIPPESAALFQERVAKTVWKSEAGGTHAFMGSVEDLIRYAPVVDEFKALDGEIVRNSIRFRWRDVREQLRTRLCAEDVVASAYRR